MGEAELTRMDYRTEDAGNARNDVELSSILPYYCSWYRLIFSPMNPSRDDGQPAAEGEKQ
jgi:hypothetical protein